MTPKFIPWLLVVVVAGGWVKCYGDKRASDALAEQRRVAWEAALDSTATVTARLGAADSALAVHEAADRRRFAAATIATVRAEAARDSTASVLDSVLASLPDTAPLSIAITREREFGTACKGALDACTDLSLTLTARVDTLTAERDLLRPALERTTEMWREAEKRSRPGFFGRLRIAAPFVAVTVPAVLILLR